MNYLRSLDGAWTQHLAPRADDAPTLVSTFAGCGGSSLGFSMAGYRERLAVEWDRDAAATFRRNFDGVAVFEGDIGELSVDRCVELAGVQPGELDVLDGSPPCQGFSTAGRRRVGDDRNQLFREFVRLLRGLRPRAFVMENVSGMVKGRMKLIFAEILRELRDAGYRVRARQLNAMYFGVPQSRERLIFVGARDDLGVKPSHPAPLGQPITTWQAVGHLDDTPDPARGHVWLDESPAGRNTQTWLKAWKAKPGQKYAGQKRRARWDRPADTLITGGLKQMKNAYVRGIGCHPRYTRTWSKLEYQLLASFPEPFKFEGDLGQAFRQIGNCVPPLFMRAIAEHVRRSVLE